MPLRTRPAPRRPLLQRTVGGLLERVRPEHLALGRAGAGLVMVARPRALPQGLGVDSAASARTSWVVQMLGAREIALGLGGLAAHRAGDRPAERLWLLAGVLSDAVDAVAVGAATGRGHVGKVPGTAVTAVALVATGIGLSALRGDEPDV